MTELGDIRARLREYYTSAEIEAWLTMIHPQLDNESPLTAIANGRAGEVFAILDRLENDVYL